MIRYEECLICNNTTDKCILPLHVCKWCRYDITFEDLYRMYRYGQPHCEYQQAQTERPFMVIKQ